MRGFAIAVVVAGCSAGPHEVRSSGRLEHEPVRWAEPIPTPPTRQVHVFSFEDVEIGGAPMDSALSDRLRKDASTVLPPMVTGPLVVLDLDAQKVETHCGDIAKRIAHQIGTMLADPTRGEIACHRSREVADETRCFQLEPGGIDVAIYVRRDDRLVGIVVGAEYAGGTAAHDAQIAKATCP